MTHAYGRALVGERAVGKVTRNQGVNLTVVGAIALDGVRALMAYEGGTTREAFMHFLQTVLLPSLNKGDVVILDNLSAHHCDGVVKAIESVGATALYLPPYSPELNPIEMAWSKLKNLLRRIGARTLRRLAAALERCCPRIQLNDIAGWFAHCGYEAQPK